MPLMDQEKKSRKREKNKKTVSILCTYSFPLQRMWDSNPRYCKAAQRFSRPPRSTTPATLCVVNFGSANLLINPQNAKLIAVLSIFLLVIKRIEYIQITLVPVQIDLACFQSFYYSAAGLVYVRAGIEFAIPGVWIEFMEI